MRNVRFDGEQMVAGHAGDLREVDLSPRAVEMSVFVVRAFVRLRQWLAGHAELSRRLDELERKYDTQFKDVFDAIRQLMSPAARKRKEIGFHVREPGVVYKIRRKGR